MCVDSVQVISSFVGFMSGYRQCKENYLLIVCFFTQIMPDAFYQGINVVCILLFLLLSEKIKGTEAFFAACYRVDKH